MIDFIKNIIKLSPIALSKNHLYDIQTKKIIRQLPQDANCIDVGCFKGEIMDLILKAAPNGQHFGIEAIPDLYNNLIQKYQHTKNVSILNHAASDTTGQSKFNFVVSNPSYSGLKKRDYDKQGEQDTEIEVSTELLDRMIPHNIQIDLIKIDVEGAEMQVLKGAHAIISKYKPLVVFEHGMGAANHYGTRPEQIFDLFNDLNMKVSNLGSYLKSNKSLSKEEFVQQFDNKEHYYFIAHS